MTEGELNEKYTEASWLIAKRSASAAGKAIFFDAESLADTTREIGSLYGLSDEEMDRLGSHSEGGTVASVQRLTTQLLSNGNQPSAGKAIEVAKTAIENNQTTTMLATLLKAGPTAAQAVANGGQIAAKGTPWGWIITAGYAVGTAGWFAYSARAFNLEVFEFVRQREGITLSAAPVEASEDNSDQTTTFEIKVPTFAGLRSKASSLGEKAGAAAKGLFGRFRSSPS